MTAFRILFAFDALVVLVLAYFFVEGLQYGRSGTVLAIWLPVLGLPTILLAAAWALRAKGRTRVACWLLVVLAIPPAAFALFFGALIAANPHWQ